MSTASIPATRPAAALDTGKSALLEARGAVITISAALVVLAARMLFHADARLVALSSETISVVSLVHGMTLFVLLGRHRVTMPGYFMASSAAIVGLSGLLVIPDPRFLEVPRPEEFLNTALFGSTLAQIGIGAMCLRADRAEQVTPVILSDSVVRRTQAAGAVALLLTVLAGDGLGSFLDGFGFSAILLICIPAFLSRRGMLDPLNCVLVLGALLAFPTLIISGTGRLRAIALLLAVAYVFFLRYGRQWLKLVGVLLVPLLLAVMGIWRREYEEALTGQHGNDTGLSSMFVAIGNFGTLIHASGEGLAPTLGLSLLSPLRAALPESLVPAWIPDAAGYELAAITDPELYGTGFSTVVSAYGELWWNFGALGLVLGVPALSLLLTRLDTWAVRSYRNVGDGPRSILVLLLFSSLVGGVGDLVWSGFHTWIVRMYARVAALLILALLTLYLPAAVARTGFVSFRDGDGPRWRASGTAETTGVEQVSSDPAPARRGER